MMRRLSGFALLFLLPAAAGAQVKLVAVGRVPADAVDKSGLTGKLEDGTPHNLLGGFGSAIAWTGKGDRYILVPDRGPSGKVNYPCRFHVADIRLALSLDGKTLLGAMQGPLIQDGGRAGLYCRLLEVDIASGKTRQFVYPLESTTTGVCEIVAITPGEYLVLERDGKKSKKRSCKINRVSLAQATDVSSAHALPKNGLPAAIVPVTKSLFLDMTLLGLDLPPKIEGLAFGPDFPDGRKLLLVTSDNDFLPGQPTMIYAFAVGPTE